MTSNQQNNKEKEVYFIIAIPSEENVNFDFKFSLGNVPKSIFRKSIQKGKGYSLDHNVFKLNILLKEEEEKENEEKEEEEGEDNEKKKYIIENIVGDDAYDILFSVTDNTFIFNAELQKGNKYLKKIVKEDIDQKIIPLYSKLDLFLEALKNTNEENKIEKLYDETIELYKKKKKFSLLISLFLKIYDKNKELCSKLLDVFREINEKGNADRDEELIAYLDKFNEIYSNAENIIKKNNYDSINFYGILFCYLYHYDKDNFPKLIEEFSEGNAEILYDILIIYYSHFKNSLNQNRDFYNNFLSYAINQKKKSNILERIINFVDDIETFIYIINENKTKIIKNYDDFRNTPITLSSNLKLIRREDKDKKEIDFIINLIKDIIDFSNDNEILLIYLASEFWKNLLKQYNKVDMENIDNCYRIREIYKKYFKLINKLYKEPDDNNKKEIKKDINKYYYRDEFAFILNKNIKKFLESKENKLNDQDKLGIVEQYNPYYSSEDENDIERYKNNRETSIFNSIKFRNPTDSFKKSFIKLDFETMFKENIADFLNKIISKIEDIETFGTIIELITVERLGKKKKDYYNLLKEKYELIIKNQLKSLKGEQLDKAIKILADFISRIYLEEDNNDFLKDRISKLDEKIKPLIYNELMKTYNDKKYEKMKQYIYDIFLNKLEDIDNIKKLIESLSNDDQKQFLIELMKKCEFEKDEFYSNSENKKLKLLCYLNDKGKLNIKYNEKIEIILDDIRNDLESENGLITKKKLEEFLNLKEEEINEENKDNEKKEKDNKLEEKKDDIEDKEKNIIIQKLGLIRLVLENYDPLKNYGDLKNNIKEINKTIKDLNFIKDSIIIFHRKQYENEIRQLTDIIKEIETDPIKEFKIQAKKDKREALLVLKSKSEDIDKVKNFLLFKKLFEKSQGKNQEDRYNEAKSKLEEINNLLTNKTTGSEVSSSTMLQTNSESLSNLEKIIFVNYKTVFKEIKDELSKKEDSISDKFIEQMIKYFNITNDETKKDLRIIIKSKIYEKVVKSIKFFFENFGNKKLVLPSNIEFSEMKLNELKIKLKDLKKIYDYESNGYFYKVFTSFYEKKEAIDFLLNKIKENKDIDYLKNKLDPTVKSISIYDIEDAINCLNHFKQVINFESLKIIEYIKYLNEETIDSFVRYSKHYPSIIELDRKNERDIFEDVYIIVNNAKLVFELDNVYFCYYIEGKMHQRNINELIDLKNKINIQSENNNKKRETKNKSKEDLYLEKCKKLKFFKDIVTNFESINDKFEILKIKGYNIPIKIIITIKYPKITYKFNENGEEKEFKDIKKYLFTIKNDYEEQLDKAYQNLKYLRFLYGSLFRKIKMHQEGFKKVPEILRYILNKVDYDDKIIDGDPNNVKLSDNYESEYKHYTKEIFNHMSEYIISLFEKNQLNYKKHFENMLIKGDISYRGIYRVKCQNSSMEQFILKLFLNKLDKMPIAQNILICSNETSIEEIQSFLYRAILCDYNTLFVIEILETFSNFQHNKMYSYVDKLLSYKLEKCENKKINKFDTKDYLNSCICFVYQNLENEYAFKNELDKYIISKKNKDNMEKTFLEDNDNKGNGEAMGDLDISMILNSSNHSFNFQSDNIKIFSSEVCGLGKSFQIKKAIKENGETYYHFPLGGKLTKKVIYEKLLKLLKKIEKDAKKKKDENKNKKNHNDYEDKKNLDYLEYNNIAIHLDLIESDETSLINEFLFSFLITKFYNNNENIKYIPNNIKIYVEVPNSFENYFSKYGILNEFKKVYIELGNLPELELENDIKKKFERILGDEQIEEFIKNHIGIEKYSYHQVTTFIKLFLSQFSFFDSKIILKNSQNDDITKDCINYFANSTKYFTNGGFAKLIMNKNKQIKDKIDLCLDAYENDLNKEIFKTPLIFIDKEKKKFKFEMLPYVNDEINDEEKAKKKKLKISSKEVDILYLIDATASMGNEIKAANAHVIKIFNKLKEKYKDYKFQFGAVFYRDQIDSKTDKNEYFPLTDDMNELKNNISKIKPYGGKDIPEDWVVGYKIALNDIKWRNGIKLIIHIADAGAHGVEYSKNDKYPDEGPKLTEYIQECAKKNINIIGFKIGEEPGQSFEKMSEIYNKYKIEQKDDGQFMEIYDFNRGENKEEEEEVVSKNFLGLVLEAADQVINPSFKYLKKLKQILDLKNDLINDEGDKKSLFSILDQDNINYVITEDNYKKMVLLYFRIKANVPVIIMGETGCGKTSLIIKLSQLLNNGENVVQIINIHPGITEEEICKSMIAINKKAKEQEFIDEEKTQKKELWAFFDEINTSLSLSLLTEIFINRTFDGEKLEDNIRLIGACNPYRRRKLTAERCGLTREDDKDDDLVYKVEQLPQSLLYYVFSFGSIKKEDEKKYIYSIIHKLFKKDEEELHKLTTEAISKSHIFLRDTFQDASIVSLREIARFKNSVEFFIDYFPKKEKKINSYIDDEQMKCYKIKSIISSIYLCYYIRLINDVKRGDFDNKIQETLLSLVNVYSKEESNEDNENNLFDKIKNQQLKSELIGKNFTQFSDFLKIEEEFLLKQVELDKGIGENELLKENLFLIFLAVVTKIPVIIVGKPGTGKSLSAQLIFNSMRGEYSKNEFFRNYPPIIQIYFQGSESTKAEDVIELFKRAEDLYKNYKTIHKNNEIVPIYMILFDELGLAEKSPANPLKVLHSKLEYDGINEGVCFIGISNYSLDAAKVNRALSLSVPNLEEKLDQLKTTSKSIVKSISEDIPKEPGKILIFYIISKAFQLYKYFLKFIKKLVVLKQYVDNGGEYKDKDLSEIQRQESYKKLFKEEENIKIEFHGNRDFYNIIKGVAYEGSKLSNITVENQIIPIIENFIERNFGGITYEIDINFDLIPNDIKDDMATLKNSILKEKIPTTKKKKKDSHKEQEQVITVNSVYLFKKIYNEACNLENITGDEKINAIKGVIYKIKDDHIDKYNLKKCIYENINDYNSRYLLLEINSSLAPLIYRIIEKQTNPDEKDINLINGSTFPDDDNNEYKIGKVGDIQRYAIKKNQIVILQNLDQIQPYLYDLYNMNYKIIDEQKYVRICLDNFSEDLTPINDTFRIIILVDEKFVDSVDMAFLNRLEKMQINFQDLLDIEQNNFIIKIKDDIRLIDELKKQQSKINYDLENLLINCKEGEIEGLVYWYYLENNKEKINENEIKDQIYGKISNLLPQDIIVNLSENNPIKKKYFEEKKYNNLISYINDLESARKNKTQENYEISIIYTFSSSINTIKGYDKTERIMISEIKTEEKLKNYIDDIKNKNNDEENKKHIILMNFEQYNSNKLQFINDYIMNYNKNKKNKEGKIDDYNYIFIIHIQRSFNIENKTKKEKKIYSIPNIYRNVNQLFIDNLQGSDLTLNDILNENIKCLMFKCKEFENLDNEFKDILINFVYEELSKKNKNEEKTLNISDNIDEKSINKTNLNEEKYSDELIKYMKKDSSFKDDIINKAKQLIELDNDSQKDCQSLINEMFEGSEINKNSVDIVTCLLDYIIENIFKKYLLYIFTILENNNFLTTLMEISKDRNSKLDKNDTSSQNKKGNEIILTEIKKRFLEDIKVNNDTVYEPKFLPNYKIPGFYNFYKDLSDYLIKNITSSYFNNEKKLRNYSDDKPKEAINVFHENEKELLNKVLEKINQDKLFDLLNKITPDLILRDYIVFYLQKNNKPNSEDLIEIIKLLLSLRFPERNEIIKNNISNPFNIIILKIIWLESNRTFIENILKAFEISKDIVNDKDGIELIQKIRDIIYDTPINYMIDEERNQKYTLEVNECFYILFAGLCLSITENIKLSETTIKDYYGRLKEINNILQNLNHDLHIHLNEIYIIDELLTIIEYELDKGIDSIINIGIINKYLIENSKIIQRKRTDKFSQLGENFLKLNDKLNEEKNDKFANKYYDTLKYIYMKEIEKIEVDSYRALILGELMKEKEIIKKSNDILQILLSNCFDDFMYIKDDLLESENMIVRLIEEYLRDTKKDYIFALTDILAYFFEKNSLIYLKDQSLEDEPLEVFEECNNFLSDLKEKNIVLQDKNKRVTKLFCISYIKSYCYIFIKSHELSDFEPDNIINKINELSFNKMIKLYIYKIIYNQNKKQINVFLSDSIKNKFKLNNYSGFEDFIKFKNEDFLIYEKKGNNNYKKILEKLNEYKKEGFKSEITDEDIYEIKEFNFDDFYIAAYNLILSKLNNEDFLDDDIYFNFYKNICEPLYKSDDEDKLLLLIQFLFDKNAFLQVKKACQIIQEDIEVLFFGYRYCLNEISEKYDDKKDYIYSVLYDENNNLNCFYNNFYPGSDTKEEEPYYDLYNKIEQHFKNNINQGCYVCLCNKGYYHSVLSGFPGYSEVNIKCPNCNNDIGAKEKYIEQKDEKGKIIKLSKIYETIKRAKYIRIFENEEEIEKLKRNKYKYNKLKEIENNYMTKEEFKQKYIQPLYEQEKGLNQINENYFKKDNKKIRNLSQLSYRLLNYILYSHLFFAKLITGKKKIDDYRPKGMTWFNTIKECFILLQKELEKKGIREIDIFMNFIFQDLFNKLHDKECINKYEDLIEFEEELEELIQKKFIKAKEEIDKFKNFEKESIKDKDSGIALLKEIYNKNDYKEKNYPYYEYFYYTDYVDEKYISNMLEHKDKNEYPLLCKYLQTKKDKKEEDIYSLDKLIIFNKVLNLFNNEYNNQITREKAEKTLIKDCIIYKKALEKKKEAEEEKNLEIKSKKVPENDKENGDNQDQEKDQNINKKKKDKKAKDLDNKELIERFIDIYNKFKFEGKNEKGENIKMELDINKNCISDLFLINDSIYGKTYKIIYEKFKEKQNGELEDLLNKKINLGIFNNNCKNSISIQQIKENEIFTFNIPKKKFDFIDVIFNSSYRKVIDTHNYENYNEYEINLDLTEIKMTDLLLKNKKLLNNELIPFRYNNEVFSYEIKDLISNFKFNDMKATLSINDKAIFYNYMIDNNGNKEKYIAIINDFITLIEYINKSKANINENTKIGDIDIVIKRINISKDFQDLFLDKNDIDMKNKNTQNDKNNGGESDKADLIVNKIPKLFDYYLKIIFKYIKINIEQYQVKKEDEDDKKKTDENKLAVNENEIKENQKFILDKDIIQKLNKIFDMEDFIIKKESLSSAIRLFISLILYREKEKDKDKKIKSNRKNVIDYLDHKDLWDINIYNDKKFKENLENLKLLNIKIKEILSFYYYLVDNKEEGFEDEVKEHLKKLKEEELKRIKEKEKLEKEERQQKQGNKLEKKKRPRAGKVKKKKNSSDSESD